MYKYVVDLLTFYFHKDIVAKVTEYLEDIGEIDKIEELDAVFFDTNNIPVCIDVNMLIDNLDINDFNLWLKDNK